MSASRPIASSLASLVRPVDDDKLKLAADVPGVPKPVSALLNRPGGTLPQAQKESYHLAPLIKPPYEYRASMGGV